MTSESARIVSIWGSPGFGKTSIAIAVGHKLQSQGLPVCFLSLRSLPSVADLKSNLLRAFRQFNTNHQSSALSPEDEFYQHVSEISERIVVILDNADDLLESGLPNVKTDVVRLLEEILWQNETLTLVVTTRESFEFMNLHFRSHKSLRVGPLDEASSKALAHQLLPTACVSDCNRVTQICAHVPLAIKLLCSLISDDTSQTSQFLDDFMGTNIESIAEMLDNPDYPRDHRLQVLFDSSFQRLSVQEKEALVSLSILPENFSSEVAKAVLGETRIFEAKKILQRLCRKSLIDSSSKPGSFSMHKLLQSFAREKGEHEMEEIIQNSKRRFCEFCVSRFQILNEQFLTGHSMLAFIAFYEDDQSIIQSLLDGCSHSEIADKVFDVLAEADLFLDALFYLQGEIAQKIYDSAIHAAIKLEATGFYCRLLASKAFGSAYWGGEGSAKHLLSKAKEIRLSTPALSSEKNGKSSCYSGICQLVLGKIDIGINCLQEALLGLDKTLEQAILKLFVFQVLAVYYKFLNDLSRSAHYYNKAIQQCKEVGDKQLLIIRPMENREEETFKETRPHKDTDILHSQPLKSVLNLLLYQATNSFCDNEDKEYFSYNMLRILEETQTQFPISVGLFNFHRFVVAISVRFNEIKHPGKLYQTKISYHKASLEKCGDTSDLQQVHKDALVKCYLDLGDFHFNNENYQEALHVYQRALDITLKHFGEEHTSTAGSYHEIGVTQYQLGDYTCALQSHQHALDVRRKLFGEEHARTADSYHEIGDTQNQLGDYTTALQSHQHALDVRRKLFGEEHARTADSYYALGITQHELGDYTSALQSHQHALDVRRKLFGEENARTADSYHEIGDTQNRLGDYTSSLQSHQHALRVRRKLFGEEDGDTADSYEEIGITQHELGDYTSAMQSHQHALDVRKKLFGEEHARTADSYYALGITQYQFGDYTSALQCHQHALDVRRKLFGEKHADTALSYYSLGISQHQFGDYTSALQSHQHALDVRRKLFGEEHARTADSYYALGITQHELGDYTSALQSHQHALDVRRKLFGEEHARTADSYYALGITQHELGDYTSALQSHQHALDVRRKLFGEEHARTADSFYALGITQHELGDYTSALQSHQHALDVRRKLFGKEHARTANSYYALGITQHELGDYTSALQSHQHALDVRRKLFGEEHARTANSYHETGNTQNQLGDYTTALQSHQHALDVRRKLFGEEHARTADSYHEIGDTQNQLGDYTSALQSHQHALDVRRKLFGEEHADTSLSYYSLGITQHQFGDYTSALQSHQHALNVRRNLFGDEHADTADSYHEIGVSHYQLGDYTSALQSHQHALDVRRKLLGERHGRTVASYRNLEHTQCALRDSFLAR